MFKAIVGADTLRTVLDSVSALVEECRIHLNDDGITVRAVDAANVGMVHLHLDAEAFESYEADGGVIGVDLTRLNDIAGMADSGQSVSLVLDEETRKLEISIDGLEYTLALIDPDAIREEPDPPSLSLPAEIVLEAADFNRAVQAADMVSDHATLRVNADETFVVEAAGDTDDVNLDLDREDLIDITVSATDGEEAPDAAASMFSMDYLNRVNKALPSGHEVTVRLGDEFPVKVEFPIAEGGGDVTYVIAPRIQG
jgi:proliferating cell nuclear antigen